MAWIIAAVVFTALICVLIVLGSRAMNVQREPGREGKQDKEASEAYDLISRWPLFTLERRIILNALERRKPRGLLLDVGCGPGYLTAAISQSYPSLKVVGFDISDIMIKIAGRNWLKRHSNLQLMIGDAHRLPFQDNSVDYVISSLSLHHWSDAKVVFNEMRRVLKPGGRILVFDLRRDSPRLFYWGLVLAQTFLVPKAIRQTNGAVGSFWASYTIAELKAMLSETSFIQWHIQQQLGWVLVYGSKVG